MPDFPLLLFPEPDEASRTKLSGGPRPIHYPSFDRQSERLAPKFSRLQEAFNNRRIEISQEATGVDPEQVIVFETIGSIDDFAKAVAKIDGFNWMDELDIEDIQPDEDFYNERNSAKPLDGRLYLVMTNQRALQELINLWNLLKENPDLSFRSGELRGLSKFKDVFAQLKDVRRWDVRDRLIETGIIDLWKENLKLFPNEPVRFELELWHRGNSVKREAGINEISSIIRELNGEVISQCVINEISYCALLAQLPPEEISSIINNPNTKLVKSDYIMFFKPTGQFSVERFEEEEDNVQFEKSTEELPDDDPVAAIFDGFPVVNHKLLENRLIIDDPENYEENYSSYNRKHGTAMASIVIHGDLNDNNPALGTKVYLRPIFKPNPSNNYESIPSNVLAIDLIHRAVKRMFDGVDETGNGVAPSVKVINLSIGDNHRHFFQIISPLGRLIDWLSHKYNVLFVISSGNHVDEITISKNRKEFTELSEFRKEEIIIRTISQEFRNRRLLSPAESINSLTIGGLHSDSSTYSLNDRIDPFINLLPSITNPIGGGFKRSIKPDLLYEAGKQLLRTTPIQSDRTTLRLVNNFGLPGIRVAAPSKAGSTSETNHCRGSSNSAALITRSVVFCYVNLKSIIEENYSGDDITHYETCILKALTVHGATWDNIGERINNIISDDIPDAKERKKIVTRMIGYGKPDIQKSISCTNQRATVIGFGKLTQEQAHIFEFPLPPSLASLAVKRKVTITMAYLSPIISRSMKYRHSNIWFSVENNSLASSRVECDHNSVRRGTLQHEIFEGETALPFEDGESLIIKVNSKPDATKDQDTEIPYGIVVSLEVAENIDIPIYNEIKTRIATAIQIQQQP